MTNRKTPRTLLLASASLALAMSAEAAKADPVSDIIVFGDSSADLGTQGAARRPTNLGEMWSERLARAIGLQSRAALEFRLNTAGDGIDLIRTRGNSYAVNGATVLPYDCCITLEQQIDLFVSDRAGPGAGKAFSGDEMVFIWMTRNDITTAIPEGLPYSAEAFATAYTAQVERLKGLGAKNLISFGAETRLLADQFGLDNGATPEALYLLREETRLAEEALWPRLARSGVYIIDTDKLGADVLSNLRDYGFVAANGSYQLRAEYLASGGMPIDDSNTPNDGNVFTVDGHYTSAMQAVVADYALAQLRAREQFGSIALQSMFSFRNLRDTANFAGTRTGARWHVYSAPVVGRIDQASSGPLDMELNETFAGAALGISHTSEGGVSWGAFVAATRQKGEFDDQGETESTVGLIGGFIAAPLARDLWVEARAAGGMADYDAIRRYARLGDVARRSAEGSTRGSYWSLGLGLRTAHQIDDWRLSAGAGVDYERLDLDGYGEEAGVLALHYGNLERKSLLGRLEFGVQNMDPVRRFRPFAALSVTHDFNDDPTVVAVGPTASTVVEHGIGHGPESAISSELGVVARLSDRVSLRVGARYQAWRGDDDDTEATSLVFSTVTSF